MHILLADDDDANRVGLAEFLGDLGYQVTECANGEEALLVYASEQFDLVLSDILMPKMSGIQLLQHIRSSPSNPDVDVALMTGSDNALMAIEALRLGADDYLLKPIDIKKLMEVVNRVAQRNRQQGVETGGRLNRVI